MKIPFVVHTTKTLKVSSLTNIWSWSLKQYREVGSKANSFPFMIPPISGVREASFGCRSLCFQGHLYSTTLFGQPSEHWHCWILSRLAPRKGFDFEIRKRFETGSSLWWVWLATRCEHSLHGIAPTPWHFVVLFPVAGNACAVSWPMQYLLPIWWHFLLYSCQVSPTWWRPFCTLKLLWSLPCVNTSPHIAIALKWCCQHAPFLHHWRTTNSQLLQLKCWNDFSWPMLI